MTGYYAGLAPEEATSSQRRKARHISVICGLALAAVTAGGMYSVLIHPAASHPSRLRTSGQVQNPPVSADHPLTSDTPITLRPLARFTSPGTPGPVEISPNGKVIVATAADGQVHVWSTSTWQQLSNFGAVEDGIPPGSRQLGPPAFSPDGNTFAAIDTNNSTFDEVANVWDVATGQSTSIPYASGSSNTPYAVVPGPNGVLADASGDKVELVNMATAQIVATLSASSAMSGGGPSVRVMFSPDGSALAENTYTGAIYLWNTSSGQSTALTVDKLYNTTSDQVDSIAFSPDGRIVACGSESGIVRTWAVSTKRNISTFTVNGYNPSGTAARPVQTMVFSPDGKRLITADNTDSLLSVWDVASGREIAMLTARSGNVASAAFTADGTLLIATTDDNTSGQDIEIWTTAKSLAAILPGS